jgi:outer membrane lipoprotein-sorting protein
MNKITTTTFLITFFFTSFSLNSLEFSCDFEEVHANGTVNQGVVLLKEDKLRYEYLNKDLFIIFVDGKETYLFDKKKQKVKNINKNLDAIQIIMKLADKFPNIENDFEENNVKIKIEFNKNINFIKRISIDSKRAKLSLYLKNCLLDKPINNIFFKFNPVFKYR